MLALTLKHLKTAKVLKSAVFDNPLSREPLEYPHKSYIATCQKLESLRYIFATGNVGLSSFKFS